MSRVLCVLKTNEGGMWVVPQLVEIRKRGHEVAVLIPPGVGRLRSALEDHSFEVIESAFDFRFGPSPSTFLGLVRFRRQIKEFQPDVLFYHLIASALAVRLATLFMRVRRVYMVAGPLYLDSPPIRLAERVLCRLDHVVIGGSEHTAERYRALGMPEQRVRAIPYGVDLARFERGPDRRQELIGARLDSFVAIMVAYVYAPKSAVYPGVGIKGHETLLEAWRRFAGGRDDVHLVLVGGGFDDAGEAHRESLMRRLQTREDPTVHWFASVDDVRPYYSSADVSVSPSLSENHGAALEASAMGCPSIVSTAGALPETVDPGVTGWMFSPGDVDGLVVALEDAFGAWCRGDLAAYGYAARRLSVARFDGRRCSRRVADVIGASA